MRELEQVGNLGGNTILV